MPSYMRAPPEAETMMTAHAFAVPYSIARVMRSPTTEPMVAARKLKSMTAMRDLVAFDHSVTAHDRVDQSGAFLIFLEPILVGGHALKSAACRPRRRSASRLDEAFRIEQVFDSLLGRLRKMIIAARTDALVLDQLDFVHDLGAARTFLPETLRHLAFLAALRLERGSFENGHGLGAGRGRRVNGNCAAGLFQDTRTFAQRRAGG